MDRKIIPHQFRDLLDYDPETGEVWWAVDYGRRIKAGTPIRNPNYLGYYRVGYKRVHYYAHRVIWFLHYGEQPPEIIDHINNDTQCNAIWNLRALDPSGNCLNRATQHGVTFNSARGRGRWCASFRRKTLYEGVDQLEAWCRRKSAEAAYHRQKAATASSGSHSSASSMPSR